MTEELELRVAKAHLLKDAGRDPYHPEHYERSAFISEVRARYATLRQDAEPTRETVTLAGRVTAIRDMGKTLFLDIRDQTGRIQVYTKRGHFEDGSYDLLRKCLDQGDWLGITGRPFRTRSGELSVEVSNYRFLTKSVRPLPLGKESDAGAHHTLEDPEIIYRQPEVGMATNQIRFETLRKRNAIIKKIREHLWSSGFDETDIPILETVYGGANARPFITHINALDQLPVYLRISLELPLKRLIVGGFDGVFHIGHVFRNEGVDRSHNPEFTLLEVYKALWDYTDIMHLTEAVITSTAQDVNGSLNVRYGERTIDLTPPWRRVTMHDILKEHTGIDMGTASDIALKALAARQNLETLIKAGIPAHLPDNDLVARVQQHNTTLTTSEGRIPIDTSRGNLIAYLFEELVEPHIIQPTFVIDHPKETSPLCKPHRCNPDLIERFELFINGWEFANAYSELNDPVLQRRLLEEQAQQLRAGEEEAMPMDEAFVQAIEYGMPTTGGLGIGIDRLVMLLTAHHWSQDAPPTIRDVIYFPLMRPKD